MPRPEFPGLVEHRGPRDLPLPKALSKDVARCIELGVCARCNAAGISEKQCLRCGRCCGHSPACKKERGE